MKKIILTIAVCGLMISCNKSTSCYDADLQEAYKKVDCHPDCTDFEGCDGKKYCNECTAASVGIGPK